MEISFARRALGVRRAARAAVVAALLAPAAAPVLAAPATSSVTVQVTPTLETAGLRVYVSGDDNANAEGTVQFRAVGDSAWRSGTTLVRTAPDRLVSLLFNLREGTPYEARVLVSDPDGGGAQAATSFTTRSTPRSYPGGRRLSVSPGESISGVLATAAPGDTILLQPGVYRERVINTAVSGTPDKPITIRPAAPGVMIRGDLPGPAQPHTAPLWKAELDGLYSTRAEGPSSYVGTDDARLYHYRSRAELVAGPRPGWWQDAAYTVYVKLAGNVSPDTLPIHIAQIQEPFLFDGVHDIILDGLDIAYFGSGFGHGVYLRNASSITVRNSRIHNVPEPVFIKGDGRNNLIENNDLFDTGMEDWPWNAVKGTDMESAGVAIVEGGSAHVVRRNRIHGIFNGLACDTLLGPDRGDTDFYYNWLHDIGDDGIEPENGNINFRAWCNTVSNVHNAVSLAPIYEGPVWILFNVLAGFHESGLKISNNTTGVVRVYHNTIVATQPGVNGMNPWTPYANVALRNNILAATRYVIEDYYAPAGDAVTLDGDLLYTSDPDRFLKWRGVRYGGVPDLRAGSGIEASGVSGDPRFIGPAGADYRIAPDSPARHAARPIPGISDFLGSAPDIGAYQMG